MSRSVSKAVAQPQRWYVREGEGTPLEVNVRHSVSVSGVTLAMLEIDFRHAPVPDRRYVADMYSVAVRGQSVSLMFGQRRVNSEKLRSLLVVQMTPSAVRQLVSTIGQVTNPTYDEILRQTGLEPEHQAEVIEEPDQTVALSANMAITAMAVDEATVDFYKASPFSLHAAPHLNKLSLDPVVRIDLRSTLLVGLVGEVRRVEQTLPKQLQGEEGGSHA